MKSCVDHPMGVKLPRPGVLNTLHMSHFSLTFVFFSFAGGEGDDKITKRDLCLVINCVGPLYRDR